jgi:competence protein ComEC
MTPLDFLNRSTNSVSCVLKISSMNGNKQQHSVLLTGDIESDQELNLVNEYGQMLQSTILLSPHHGSKTSSSIEFLNEVNPEHIVIQNGYRNRYGHPHPLVSQRYTEAGIKQWRSDADGAVVVDINSELDGPIKIQAWRTVAKRYWHTVMPPTD